MKARIKATGEVVKVHSYSRINHEIEVEPSNYYGNYETYDLDKVTLILEDKSKPNKQIDYWDEKLIQLSGMAMQGILSSNFDGNIALTEKSTVVVSKYSLMCAKELIKQLKEELK